jgi:hypothetical protein
VRNSRCTHTYAGRAQTSELCVVYLVLLVAALILSRLWLSHIVHSSLRARSAQVPLHRLRHRCVASRCTHTCAGRAQTSELRAVYLVL